MHVNIIQGTHRGASVTGVFPLAKPYKTTTKGGQLTITVGKNPPAPFVPAASGQARITVDDTDQFTYCDAEGNELDPSEVAHTNDIAAQVAAQSEDVTDYAMQLALVESDDEAMDRIQETFDIFDEMVDTCAEGITRGLVVSGPPGIGKSFGVLAKLKEANMFRTIKGDQAWYDEVSGAATPIALYKKLYDNRFPGFVTVFDDCDNILYDEVSLNLLKAALDSKKTRNLSWLAESRALRDEEIPNTFEFEGSVIFLTNTKFDGAKGKIADHLQAIVSRCHYLDLSIDSQRDQLLRIKQIVREGMLDEYNFEGDEAQMIVDYIENNSIYMRELSLRMVKKIADLVKAKPDRWERLAQESCLTKQARFKRLLEARNSK
jgi:hypothetical protein